MQLRALLTSAVVVLVTTASRAHAQPAAAQAEVLFRKGKLLLQQGKIAEACAAFDASQKQEPTISTLLNRANCRETNNQLATAWGLFLEAERETRAATDAATRQLHQTAADHAAKLEPRLSTLTIGVTDGHADGLEVRRDTEVIDPAAWNQPLPIDGGTYQVSAKAPGLTEWSTTITIEPQLDAKTVRIPIPDAHAPRAADKADKAKVGADARKKPEPRWACTASRSAEFGACKRGPGPDDTCDAFRATWLATFADLTPCHEVESMQCFDVGGLESLFCAPTPPTCEAMRAAVRNSASVTPSACYARKAS